MAWPKLLTGDKDKKEEVVPNDPEKKADDKKAEPEKSPADLIAEALKPFNETMVAMKAELDELRTKTTPKAKREIASVMENEDEAFNERLTPIMERQLATEARIAKDDVEREYKKAGYGDLWDENRKDIDEFLGQAQLVTVNAKGETVLLRGNPEYIRNIADMMIGRAVKKGGVKFDGKDKKFFLEDTNGDGIVRTEKTAAGITKKQLEAAKRFNIPIEDYRKAMAKLKFVDRDNAAN